MGNNPVNGVDPDGGWTGGDDDCKGCPFYGEVVITAKAIRPSNGFFKFWSDLDKTFNDWVAENARKQGPSSLPIGIIITSNKKGDGSLLSFQRPGAKTKVYEIENEELEVIMELLIDIRPTRLGPTQGRRVKKSTIQPIKGKSTVTTVYKVTIDETSKGMAELVHKMSGVFTGLMENKSGSSSNIPNDTLFIHKIFPDGSTTDGYYPGATRGFGNEYDTLIIKN
jgi:hypothetical protein